MPRDRKPFARIAITMPQEVLEMADRLAARLDRSRSWVIAESIRRFAVETPIEYRGGGRVREVAAGGYPSRPAPGLGAYRHGQLEADLRLTPEERVRAAEATARLDRLIRPSQGQQLLVFERREDYLRWKQRESAG
jgi:hypothetical protein